MAEGRLKFNLTDENQNTQFETQYFTNDREINDLLTFNDKLNHLDSEAEPVQVQNGLNFVPYKKSDLKKMDTEITFHKRPADKPISSTKKDNLFLKNSKDLINEKYRNNIFNHDSELTQSSNNNCLNDRILDQKKRDEILAAVDDYEIKLKHSQDKLKDQELKLIMNEVKKLSQSQSKQKSNTNTGMQLRNSHQNNLNTTVNDDQEMVENLFNQSTNVTNSSFFSQKNPEKKLKRPKKLDFTSKMGGGGSSNLLKAAKTQIKQFNV